MNWGYAFKCLGFFGFGDFLGGEEAGVIYNYFILLFLLSEGRWKHLILSRRVLFSEKIPGGSN